MRVFKGIPVSEGVALGPLYRLRHTTPGLGRRVGDPRYELALYETSVRLAAEELTALEERAEQAERMIFTVQRTMLADNGLGSEIRNYINAGAGAAAAVERAAGIYAAKLRDLQDGYFSERAADVLDMCQRVVDILDGVSRRPQQVTEPSILISDEIYPSDIVTLDRSLILGIVMCRGSSNSHAAIIARSLGVPAVAMVGMESLENAHGATAAVDGVAGTLTVSPDESAISNATHKMARVQARERALLTLRNKPCVTRDGTPFTLYANCATPEDVTRAMELGAQGVGLLRSELALLSRNVTTEDEQYDLYSQCLEAARGKPVIASIFDLGAEKSAAGLVDTAERNPALGLRGVRYCLAHKTFFTQHLMALLRAAQNGPLWILLPMITSPEDVDDVRRELSRAKELLRVRRLPFSENVPIGGLIETPAAALCASELAQTLDFFHIGTNDLTQYTYAMDRQNPALQSYFEKPVPAMRRLMRMTHDAAREADIPLCICGESASDPACAISYMHMGFRTFSVSPARLLPLKEQLLQTTL